MLKWGSNLWLEENLVWEKNTPTAWVGVFEILEKF